LPLPSFASLPFTTLDLSFAITLPESPHPLALTALTSAPVHAASLPLSLGPPVCP
jgi:hypothetical protein